LRRGDKAGAHGRRESTAVGGCERAFEESAFSGLPTCASKGHLCVALQPNVGTAQRRLILGERFAVENIGCVHFDVGAQRWVGVNPRFARFRRNTHETGDEHRFAWPLGVCNDLTDELVKLRGHWCLLFPSKRCALCRAALSAVWEKNSSLRTTTVLWSQEKKTLYVGPVNASVNETMPVPWNPDRY
jgi:hypothetical protein